MRASERALAQLTERMVVKRNSFWLLVLDDDKKIFALHGPMLDDTELTNNVAKAKKSGRSITCQSIPGHEDRPTISARWRGLGYASGAIWLP